MKPICEVVVRYLLPMMRAMVARELYESYGMKQEDAAKKLGLTQAAVSYYLSGRRGKIARKYASMFKEMPSVKNAVKEIARLIAKENCSVQESVKAICTLCASLRLSQELCKLHSDTTLCNTQGCDVCSRILMHGDNR